MSYISPPLIRARLSGMNQGIQEVIAIREAQWVDIGRFQRPINALSKGALYLVVWFSCHHYLTVHDPRRHMCQLPLVSVRFFGLVIADYASLLLIRCCSPFPGSYKYPSLNHSIIFSLFILRVFSLPCIHLRTYPSLQNLFLS